MTKTRINAFEVPARSSECAICPGNGVFFPVIYDGFALCLAASDRFEGAA